MQPLAALILHIMGRQSTRHKYRSRGDKNRSTARAVRLVLLAAMLFGLFMLVRHLIRWWPYYASYFE